MGNKGADLRKVTHLAAMYDMLPCTIHGSKGPRDSVRNIDLMCGKLNRRYLTKRDGRADIEIINRPRQVKNHYHAVVLTLS